MLQTDGLFNQSRKQQRSILYGKSIDRATQFLPPSSIEIKRNMVHELNLKSFHLFSEVQVDQRKK